MSAGAHVLVRLTLAVLFAGGPRLALADETDNFTCRQRPLADAQDALDDWVNTRIAARVERASRGACDADCLIRDLRAHIGASAPHPATLIPHARLAMWIQTHPGIDRCRLAFGESVYGARPYDRPWLFPFTGRIIFLADSIRLAGRIVGIDKINHFLREGLAHWHDVRRGKDIAAVMARERGAPDRQLLMNEHGLKGLSLTGVVSYADLAASYSGFEFWRDMLAFDGPASLVTHDESTGRFVVRRRFSVADYVNDAWDEAINPSTFDPRLGREVAAALRARGLTWRAADCRALARLPRAELYVNPHCVQGVDAGETRQDSRS
jgi:hypothetical protein